MHRAREAGPRDLPGQSTTQGGSWGGTWGRQTSKNKCENKPKNDQLQHPLTPVTIMNDISQISERESTYKKCTV